MVGIEEDAFVIQVRMGKRTVSALIHNGTKPSVIDPQMLQDLELETEIVSAPRKLYGLINTPVKVLGYVDADVQIGKRPSLIQHLQVLGN